jgi:hypothetical protein
MAPTSLYCSRIYTSSSSHLTVVKNKIYISERVLQKLSDKHGVRPDEIRHCFENREGRFLEDVREDHKSDPPTQWFIAETNQRRRLKVVFVVQPMLQGKRISIRTAYEPNPAEINIYERYGK